MLAAPEHNKFSPTMLSKPTSAKQTKKPVSLVNELVYHKSQSNFCPSNCAFPSVNHDYVPGVCNSFPRRNKCCTRCFFDTREDQNEWPWICVTTCMGCFMSHCFHSQNSNVHTPHSSIETTTHLPAFKNTSNARLAK